MQPLYQHSAVWRHSLEKPFGYPGDYSVLELVYDQMPHPATTSPLGVLIDVWSEKTTLPRAVVARKDALRFYLESIARTNDREAAPIPVLSVGAGAAREVREVRSDWADRLDVTLVDTDARPLAFAESCVRRQGKGRGLASVVADAINTSLQAVLPRRTYAVVYSFGVVDYLPDKYALRLLKNCREMIDAEGSLLFCIKDFRLYEPWFYEWFYDWRFVPRSAEEGVALAERAGLKVTRCFSVEGGVITIDECKLNGQAGA